MKKKILALMLAALMPVSFSACGNSGQGDKQKDGAVSQESGTKDGAAVPKAADVMSSARKNIAEITSLEAKTLFEMKMDVTEGAETMPVEMSITSDMTCFYDPVRAKMDMTIDSGEQGEISSQMYISTDKKGNAVMYVDNGNGTWASQKMEADILTKFDMPGVFESVLKDESEFKEAGTEQVDGVDTYRYEGFITGKGIEKAMAAAGGAGMGGAFDSLIPEADALEKEADDLGSLKISMWIDQKTLYPVKYEMDLTDLIRSYMDKILEEADMQEAGSVDVSKVKISFSCSNFNQAEEFTLPDESKEI